jgi:hypothetical protein
LALHEGEVHAGVRIAQQLEVLGGPGGAAQFDLDAVLLEHGGVTLAELGVGALVGAGGQHDLLRRRRVQHLVGQQQQQQRDHDERTGGDEQVAHRQQGMAQGLGHGRLSGGSKGAR